MCIRNLIKQKYGIDLPIHGGQGKEIDDPIVVELTEKNNIPGIEYLVLIFIGEINNYDWQPIGQTLHLLSKKKVDQIDIQIFEEDDSDSFRIEKFYFEITECFDRFSDEVERYIAQH